MRWKPWFGNGWNAKLWKIRKVLFVYEVETSPQRRSGDRKIGRGMSIHRWLCMESLWQECSYPCCMILTHRYTNTLWVATPSNISCYTPSAGAPTPDTRRADPYSTLSETGLDSPRIELDEPIVAYPDIIHRSRTLDNDQHSLDPNPAAVSDVSKVVSVQLGCQNLDKSRAVYSPTKTQSRKSSGDGHVLSSRYTREASFSFLVQTWCENLIADELILPIFS